MSADAGFDVAILAGGRSTRMGCDKTLLVFEGRTLLARQVELAWSLGPQTVFVVGRTPAELGELNAHGLPDAPPGQGPLGGLATVLAATRSAQVLLLAVDMPMLTREFLLRLLRECRAGLGVVPRTARGWEPTAAVYPKELALDASRAVSEGRRALHAFVEQQVGRGRLRAWAISTNEEGLFVNWNTPIDLPRGTTGHVHGDRAPL
ncbi:MAG: molybdenum cofactor guanylyltransferase [Opitutaceae bacterium]|nr:molybdenum cofactor guanylyltransferase [Opitutaceae bacterium]